MQLQSNAKASNQTPLNSHASGAAPLIFISAGDPSGDAHAAKLVEALTQRLPDARFVAFAGPKTAATRCDVRVELTKFAVMMLKKAVINLVNYARILKAADDIFLKEKPDVVVIVDFPSFNWRIAKKAKAAGIPVVYFMPPQIWGWGQRRVKKMRKYVDLILSCFEFENKWFLERGCRSIFIGHPFFEEARSRERDEAFIEQMRTLHPRSRFVAVLPGSRNQEVADNIGDLVSAAEEIQSAVPNVMPIFAAYNDNHAMLIRSRLQERNLNFTVCVGKTPEVMRLAECCFGVSGSVSIELLSLCKPAAIQYRVSRAAYIALRFLKRVKYVTLVNILAVDEMDGETPFYPAGTFAAQTEHTTRERELMLFPEFLSYKPLAKQVSAVVVDWLKNDEHLREKAAALEELRRKTDLVEHPILRAAQVIDEEFIARKIETYSSKMQAPID